MNNWNGEERRKGWDRRDEDHDLLIQIHGMITAMQETHRDHVKTYDKHVEDDEGHFGRLYKGQSRLAWLVAVGIGGLSVLKFFLK